MRDLYLKLSALMFVVFAGVHAINGNTYLPYLCLIMASICLSAGLVCAEIRDLGIKERS